MEMLSKCFSGAAENVKISNFSLMFIGYASFYCIIVQIIQFPVLDFGLDQYGSEPFNYRPISLLSVLSKLLERHMYSQITSHLETHHPLSTSQWGFQSGRSTVTALLETTHNWLQFMDTGKEVGAVFFDLQKAFDSMYRTMPCWTN